MKQLHFSQLVGISHLIFCIDMSLYLTAIEEKEEEINRLTQYELWLTRKINRHSCATAAADYVRRLICLLDKHNKINKKCNLSPLIIRKRKCVVFKCLKFGRRIKIENPISK